MIERDRCEDITRHAHHYVDMVPHLATLTRLASEARSVVELGTRGGVSTWALLDGLPADGTLTSIDIDATARDLVPRRVLLDPRWSFIAGDDLDVRMPLADLVFIDTSHEFAHTRAELAEAALAGASVIALHDYTSCPPVALAVDLFIDAHGWDLELEPSAWGLAILRKPQP